VLIGNGWSRTGSGRFISGEEPLYPFCRKLDGPRGWSRRMQKSRPPPPLGFKPQISQNVASRHADYAVLAARMYVKIMYYTGRSFRSGNIRCDADIFPLATDDSACCVVASPPLSHVKKKKRPI